MDNDAEKKEINIIDLPSIKSKNPISENPGPPNSQNKDSAENKLRTILEDDNIINDLRVNPNSIYKKNLTKSDIIELINFCLFPNEKLDKKSKEDKRYPYYSSLLLLSQVGLLFNKSVNNLKEANHLEKKKESKIDNVKEEKSQNNKEKIKIEILDKSQEINNYLNYNNLREDIYEQITLEKEEMNFDYFNFRNEYENEIDDKYFNATDTEIKKNSGFSKPITQYGEEEKVIINDILDAIFKILEYKDILQETYWGYFQALTNFMLFNESNIVIEYLFREPNLIIKKFYKHLNKIAVQNIMENLLNIISDNEEKEKDIKNSKFNLIINDLLKELEVENDNENKLGKSENICELIINTLINNSEKQLIKLIFNDNKISIFEKIINKLINNNKKTNGNDEKLRGVLKILCQLNNIIMNSFNESSNFKKYITLIDFSINEPIKTNTYEYKYTSKKLISIKNIFNAYEQNISSYLSSMNNIFNLVKEDIFKRKQIIKNNKNKNEFGLTHLFEWQFIHSCLKLYIYSFYSIENLNKKDIKYFSNKKIYKYLINYYFYFWQNSLYQNIFIEILKLICNEKCPEYLVQPFLKKYKNKNQNNLIYKVKKIMENKKKRLLTGTNIEILKLFYKSLNPYILKHFKNSKLDSAYKTFFIKSLIPKLEIKLIDDYKFSESEIFNSDNEKINTFDGNDDRIKPKLPSFCNIVEKFINKCKAKEKEFICLNNKEEMNEKIKKKIIKEKIEIGGNIYRIDEERNIINKIEENLFEIYYKVKEIKLDEENIKEKGDPSDIQKEDVLVI